MHLVIHGHFYQPPRENPWTGRIPRQEEASPHHDWNDRIASQCYAPNAWSRVLDEQGRIEEIVNNYEWIHFDFGPTLLSWMEREEPRLYREILEADRRSMARQGGHGNAIAQAYNHAILPLMSMRDKRTQVRWGLRDFEHRFGRPSESIWLPETAIDAETLRVLLDFGIRYVILAPHQAKRVRSLSGGAWKDVSGGRIDPRRAYRARLRGAGGKPASIDVFFYDGPVSAAISFDHLLRSAPELADRLQGLARGAKDDALVHAATDGEVYGHHEPFGDMCLAYLATREAPLRGMELTNYGRYLELHPPRHEVEIDFGPDGDGTSWSCAHGVDRWRRDCGCSTGGRTGWTQAWRAPLRRALEQLQDDLNEIYIAEAADLVIDPWEARDDYIEILLDPDGGRTRFLDRHAKRALAAQERQKLWRLLESQRHGMLMFTSCAWFFADVSGIEVRQNLAYAARAIEMAQPFGRRDLEQDLLSRLALAQGNRPETATGAEVWHRFVRPMRRSAHSVAIEAGALLAAGDGAGFGQSVGDSPAFAIDILEREGNMEAGRLSVRLVVRDRSTEESIPFRVVATPDPAALIRLRAFRDEVSLEGGPLDRASGKDESVASTGASGQSGVDPSTPPVAESTADDLPKETRSTLVRALLAEILAREERRFEELFESSRALIDRYHGKELILPPIFQALASHVIDRRYAERAAELSLTPPSELRGSQILQSLAGDAAVARAAGVVPRTDPVAGVIERALIANLSGAGEARTADAQRSVDLILAAEKAGVEIRRTRLEEMVYALLSHHREALAAKLAGRKVPLRGVDPDVLIQLAEQSNVSLRSFERAPAHTA